jgi:hypothetical protein
MLGCVPLRLTPRFIAARYYTPLSPIFQFWAAACREFLAIDELISRQRLEVLCGGVTEFGAALHFLLIRPQSTF